jgi:GGDEF domain-containing protein
MGVLTIREAVTGRARFNLFTQAIAWSLTLGGIALLSAGFMVMVTNSIFLGGTRANPAGAVILTDLSRHFLVSVSLVCVAGLIARPIRRSLGPDTAHAFVDVPVGDVVNRVPAILNRAKAQHRDLALITVTIEDAFDFLNVFGQEGLDTVSKACVDVLRAQVSPLALVGELHHDQYFVLLETADVEATEALVANLGQQLTTASLAFGGRFALAGRFAYADTRADGYDWDHLLAQAESRLQPGRPLSPAPPSV